MPDLEGNVGEHERSSAARGGLSRPGAFAS